MEEQDASTDSDQEEYCWLMDDDVTLTGADPTVIIEHTMDVAEVKLPEEVEYASGLQETKGTQEPVPSTVDLSAAAGMSEGTAPCSLAAAGWLRAPRIGEYHYSQARLLNEILNVEDHEWEVHYPVTRVDLGMYPGDNIAYVTKNAMKAWLTGCRFTAGVSVIDSFVALINQSVDPVFAKIRFIWDHTYRLRKIAIAVHGAVRHRHLSCVADVRRDEEYDEDPFDDGIFIPSTPSVL